MPFHSVLAFVDDACVTARPRTDGGATSGHPLTCKDVDLWGAYKAWCEQRGATPSKKRAFVAAVAEAGGGLRDTRPKTWEGIALRAAVADDVLVGASMTETGNARRLAALHGADLRYVFGGDGWHVWDGRRWAVDGTEEHLRRAKATAQAVAEAATAALDSDELDRKGAGRLHKFAVHSMSKRSLLAMVDLAQNEPGMYVRVDDLDRDPFLLNCANGTLDLQTGRLRPHRRGDHLTALVDVAYDEGAPCERWERFLAEVTGGDGAFAAFLKRAAGYTLTGDTREEALLFLYGHGANGKTTFTRVLQDLLGPYAQSAPPELLVGGATPGAASPEVARARGKRMLVAAEVDGKPLNEAKVKALTGRERIAARGLYEGYAEFEPAFKLWIHGNHKPEIKGADEGIWRRIHVLPFSHRIPRDKRDPTLGAKLRDELAGVLRWAVEGCLEWQREGLGVPECVRRESEAYREEMDALNGFLEGVFRERGAEIPTADLYGAYERWAQGEGERPMSKIAFGRHLGERGFEPVRTRTTRMWRHPAAVRPQPWGGRGEA